MANLAGQRTFVQIQNEIGQNLFADVALSTTTHPTLAHTQQVINKHYKRFTDQFRNLIAIKETTFNTVAGTTDYAMDDTAAEVLQMAIRSLSQKISYISRLDFLNSIQAGWTGTGQGVPYLYMPAPAASNNALKFSLYPTPADAYTVTYQYVARPTALSSDSDVPVIQPEYDPYLVHAPLYELMSMLGDPRAVFHKEQMELIWRHAWKRNQELADSMASVKEYSPTIAGPMAIQPYE